MEALEHISKIVFGISIISGASASLPLVVNTWPWPQATDAAWGSLTSGISDTPSLDAVQAGCTKCEEDQCDGTVGFGGSPDENGETTLDAMIMDGTSMNIGAVAALRRVKNAIGVARRVLDNTEHTMLAGELATNFAIENGFPEETLSTDHSVEMWENWKKRNCQPNYRTNVVPNSKTSCGPYRPIHNSTVSRPGGNVDLQRIVTRDNHDTIGMVAIDGQGRIAAGTSTNGKNHKVPGRVGDSPIPGAGSYADDDVGAAVATGDGDIMMRFLPTYQIVESMRQGKSPQVASEDALHRMIKHYPSFSGAVVGVSSKGEIGAACTGFDKFFFCARDASMTQTTIYSVPCV